jgi:hypothetical protein
LMAHGIAVEIGAVEQRACGIHERSNSEVAVVPANVGTHNHRV